MAGSEDEREDMGGPVELTDQETAVMLGTFAGASFFELASSTGLPPPELEVIVTRLTNLGLIEPQLIPLEPEAPQAAEDGLVALLDDALADLSPPRADIEPPRADRSPSSADRSSSPADRSSSPVDRSFSPADLTPPAPLSLGSQVPERMIMEAGEGGGEALDLPPSPPLPGAAPSAEPSALERAAPGRGGLGGEVCADAVIALTVDEPVAEAAEDTREYRKLYETELHPLPIEERLALAGQVTGARLFALCFDVDPKVIVALFDNTSANVEHARLVALHHRTTHGLNELVRRAALLSDPLVNRRLVRNPAVDEGLFRRLMGNKRLLEVHKTSLDHDVPERSRAAARIVFRSKWATAQSEEKVEIVWATEGRILLAMAGLTFDSRTTSLLCSRTYVSVVLIQNLARFPATPPPLIGHLFRQPLVKRQQHLKNLLLQHPNTPSDLKRRL